MYVKTGKSILLVMLIILAGSVGHAETGWMPRTGFERNMVVFGHIDFSGFNFKSGTTYLYSFGPRGEGDCRSVSKIKEDGTYYMTIAGDKRGESITFKGVDDKGQIVPFTNKLIFQPDETLKELIIH